MITDLILTCALLTAYMGGGLTVVLVGTWAYLKWTERR